MGSQCKVPYDLLENYILRTGFLPGFLVESNAGAVRKERRKKEKNEREYSSLLIDMKTFTHFLV